MPPTVQSSSKERDRKRGVEKRYAHIFTLCNAFSRHAKSFSESEMCCHFSFFIVFVNREKVEIKKDPELCWFGIFMLMEHYL